MSSASKPPKSFSDLPPEIRCHIWNLCVSDRRILPFSRRSTRIPGYDRISSFHALPPPNLLYVCHESREETLRCFRYACWGNRADEENGVAINAYTSGWWNPSMDIIHVPYWLPSDGLPPGMNGISTTDAKWKDLNFVSHAFRLRMKDMQHFACSMKSLRLRWQWEEDARAGRPWNWNGLAKLLHGFPNLKTFTWIVDYTTYRYKKDGPQWVDHPNFPIEGIWRNHASRHDMTPPKIQSGLQQSFECVKSELNDPHWKPPQVRIVLDKEDKEECLRREQRYRRMETGINGTS
ncbi:hypothetical protein DSL72_006861 [Monilinia vaccinii-corymbosi]|uniref:2EXR domain-containing protein n=1 Tax=Monilinia vaccinii-corymbosi TaxID=61207 RepID=A0A8A3PL89_9HELO|nr:hypothetical protein DSL72_006861 [Monilinia vaccinii-corymbosi]